MTQHHPCPSCRGSGTTERPELEEQARIRAWAERHNHATHPADSLRLEAAAEYLDYTHTQSLRNAISQRRLDLQPQKIGGRVRVLIADIARVSITKQLNF